ncbi:hypothetical protein APV95_08210 [Staphylococcus aureus]|nr:hypothetical protein APV95_08210 [Staphylococcus aureus]
MTDEIITMISFFNHGAISTNCSLCIALPNANKIPAAGKMMGDGIGFIPEKGEIVAPFDGTVKTIFPTKHAIGLESESGVEVLIHIGIDTVKLNGEGFESLINVDEKVTQGQPLMKVNLAYLKAHAPSIVTPMIITNLENKELVIEDVQDADPGKLIMTVK